MNIYKYKSDPWIRIYFWCAVLVLSAIANFSVVSIKHQLFKANVAIEHRLSVLEFVERGLLILNDKPGYTYDKEVADLSLFKKWNAAFTNNIDTEHSESKAKLNSISISKFFYKLSEIQTIEPWRVNRFYLKREAEGSDTGNIDISMVHLGTPNE